MSGSYDGSSTEAASVIVDRWRRKALAAIAAMREVDAALAGPPASSDERA